MLMSLSLIDFVFPLLFFEDNWVAIPDVDQHISYEIISRKKDIGLKNHDKKLGD